MPQSTREAVIINLYMIQQGIESSIHATSVYVGLRTRCYSAYFEQKKREAAKKRVDGCIRRLATVKDEALKFFAVIKQICAYQSLSSVNIFQQLPIHTKSIRIKTSSDIFFIHPPRSFLSLTTERVLFFFILLLLSLFFFFTADGYLSQPYLPTCHTRLISMALFFLSMCPSVSPAQCLSMAPCNQSIFRLFSNYNLIRVWLDIEHGS
ncbi:Uncharacterized protein APZ42_021303 [Daphnia magna]|uniref:Uncharacterized protein n=1 Tax=Daphnia magna TaxID=35525 RepID=A0A164WSY6_9CRUS|nr:Uncharacterized protein APZ42_021303 [Daphnia magna]